MSDLIILTEAGGAVGYGHLTRCQAIADCMDTKIYVHADGCYPETNKVKSFAWRTKPAQLIKDFPSKKSILIDSYLASVGIYELFSNHFHHVSVIDDYDRLVYPVELVINPGVKLPEYKNQTAQIIGGNEYIILRKEIIQHSRKTDYQNFRNLLVTFGGCDSSHVFEWLIPLLAEHQYLSVTIVTGNAENSNELSKKFNVSSVKWLGQIDALDMAALMYQSDICISAGGQTLHELAFIGVPTISIETGLDQINNIDGYIDSGFLLKKLSLQNIDLKNNIADLLMQYRNKELRIRTAEIGKNLVDGLGSMRIAKLL